VDYRFFIARRYLISPKQISLISIITGISIAGVALGVAALIVVLSVMNGFFDFVRDMLVSLDPHVRIERVDERGFAEVDSLMEVALSIPHVEHAAAYVEGKALLLHEGSSEANRVIIVRGVDPDALSGVSDIVGRTGFGRFDVQRRNGDAGIVLGMSLGRRLGLLPGAGDEPASEVGLLSAPGIERVLSQPFGGLPVARFEVRGLFEMQETYEDTHVFIGLEEAQRLFRLEGRYSGIELRLDDLEEAAAVKAELQQRLDPERFSVRTWYDLQESLYDVMQLEKWGASAILMLIVVVAAFNIIGSLTMVVIEKVHDVGVLQAMGVSRRNIRRIFLIEGLLIGVVGAGLGLVLGLGLALLQKTYELVPLAGAESFLIDAYPVAIHPIDVVLIVGASLGLCILAAVYPAFRAASVDPARAVQMEG
jgi:lipoprotein-releasing system permease protein